MEKASALIRSHNNDEMNSTDTLPTLPPATDAPNAPRRRNREELEQLAAEFVNSRLIVRTPLPRRVPKAALAAAGAVVAVAALAWVLWPTDPAEAARDAAPAVADSEQWAQRLEAERERQRRQLEQARAHSAKMAAADNALVSQLTVRARQLAARSDAPATAQPAPAAAASCGIHVSELSDSGALTYADVVRMKGARLDAATGHVFTPPVQAGGDGPTVVFEVMPTGCVRIARKTAR
jgi:hypothetical protein